MKKFLSIYGIVLFLFVTYLLLNEIFLPFDSSSSLYFFNGDNIGVLSYFTDLYNLSPFTMGCVHLSVLIAIIASIKTKKLYIIITIGNLVISIPIFMVHKDTMVFTPFHFMDDLTGLNYILNWVFYIYLSILGMVMLGIYIFTNSSKRTAQQMATIKKIIKFGLITITVGAIIYIAQSLYLSFKTNYIVKLSYDTNGQYSKKLENIITQDDFECLNYGRHKNNITQEFDNTFPLTILLGDKAYSNYEYAYQKINIIDSLKGNILGVRVKVKWKLKNFRWVITDVYEHP